MRVGSGSKRGVPDHKTPAERAQRQVYAVELGRVVGIEQTSDFALGAAKTLGERDAA